MKIDLDTEINTNLKFIDTAINQIGPWDNGKGWTQEMKDSYNEIKHSVANFKAHWTASRKKRKNL